MTISTISVTDMHCSACAVKIRKALQHLSGIEEIFINPARRQVLVEHSADIDSLQILKQIEATGFNPALAGVDNHNTEQRILLKRLGIAGLAMSQVMMVAIALYAGALDTMTPAVTRLLEYTSLVFCIPVISYSAMPFFVSALSVLKAPRRGINMDVPIALAIAIAFLASLSATLTGEGAVYYDSVVMFTFLLLGARYIDNRLQRQFNTSSQLLSALPEMATLMTNDERQVTPITMLATGDRVWVSEGAQVPVDGLLISETAQLDEALLTGESEWLRKQPGDAIYAGTLNRGCGFEFRATAACERSRIADIAALADRAKIENAPAAQLANRIAGIFVPSILALAALTYLGWQFVDPGRALIASLTVLVVSCPCALSLATPAALTAAMTRLRQLGIVLTRSSVLEQSTRLDKVFIDKTGTLTVHEPRIESIEVLNARYTEQDCLALACALQQFSNHPYASAFIEHAGKPQADAIISQPETVTGQGVQGIYQNQRIRIGSAAFAAPLEDGVLNERLGVYLSINDKPCARFRLSDQLRSDAQAAINTLRGLGIEPVMLSGDAPERCAETARRLNIDYLAAQTPESKLAELKREQAAGRRVLMIGDGINDIPVLAGADVSVAMVESNDLVKSKADVLLLTRKLAPLSDLIRMARATVRITRQNLAWAALYNITAIPLAAFGFMPPWLAAAGMASSSTLVMLNATRLLRMPSSSYTQEDTRDNTPG